MLATLALLTSLGPTTLTAQIGEAPERLITSGGVEITADGRVFTFFAALNALGYASETEHRGPPLRAPLFHPIREASIEKLRSVPKDKLNAIRSFFDKHPKEIKAYLGAILAHDLALEKAPALRGDAKALAGIVPLLTALAQTRELNRLYSEVQPKQRAHMLEIKAGVDKAFGASKGLMGDFRAPTSLVIISNPLDAHGIARTITVNNTTYVVVGPGVERAVRAVVEASVRPHALEWAKAAAPKAPKLKKSWATLKVSSRITKRYPSLERYLGENLTQAMTYKIVSKGLGRKTLSEDSFTDQQAKKGLRWTRAFIKSLPATARGSQDAIVRAVAGANI